MQKRTDFRNGFTLIELLVVVAIVGVLTGIVIGVSSMAKRKSTESKTMAELQVIRDSLEEYRLQYGAFPIVEARLDEGGFALYLDRIKQELNNPNPRLPTKDPWGRGYYYACTNGYAYVLISQGQDATDIKDDIDGTAGDL